MRIAISEIFGPTIQGEGPSAGNPAVFLRLAGCNLTCSWCDTAYTWDWDRFEKSEEVTITSPAEVIERIKGIMGSIPLLVITGGEPMGQWAALDPIIDFWLERGIAFPRVEIETNGTKPAPPGRHGMSFNVSPKLPSANQGSPPLDLLRDWAIRSDAILKFVIKDWPDVDALDDLMKPLGWRLDPTEVFLMPEGQTVAELDAKAKRIAEIAIARGYRYTDRLHIRIWGDKRGH